jgi:hypothetical protein
MKSFAVLFVSLAVVTAFAPQHNVAPTGTKLNALADAVCTTTTTTFLLCPLF